MSKLVTSTVLLLLLSACGTGDDTAPEPAVDENQDIVETEPDETDTAVDEAVEADGAESSEQEAATEENPSAENDAEADNAVADSLELFSTEEIEYARVWLNFGANPEAEQVYVENFPAGTPINPDVNGSVEFPEDVIHLSGGRRVDGAVTYSSNGDGTVNLYNVPYSWDMNADVEDAVYIEESEKVLDTVETQYVEPLEDEAVREMIGKLIIRTEP